MDTIKYLIENKYNINEPCDGERCVLTLCENNIEIADYLQSVPKKTGLYEKLNKKYN